MASVQQQPCKDPMATQEEVLGSLARLTPVNLMPEQYSRHMQIMTKLKQICKVQVSRSSDKRYYRIDVFTPSQSTTRIPTSIKAVDVALNLQQPATQFRTPDVRVEKQFTDFVKLRDELYATAYPHMSCRFCSEVIRYLLIGAVLPGSLSTWMLSRAQRTKAVERFVQALLLLAVSCPVVETDACSCQEKLPQLLFQLLFDEADED
jgi:hypothetical protein